MDNFTIRELMEDLCEDLGYPELAKHCIKVLCIRHYMHWVKELDDVHQRNLLCWGFPYMLARATKLTLELIRKRQAEAASQGRINYVIRPALHRLHPSDILNMASNFFAKQWNPEEWAALKVQRWWRRHVAHRIETSSSSSGNGGTGSSSSFTSGTSVSSSSSSESTDPETESDSSSSCSSYSSSSNAHTHATSKSKEEEKKAKEERHAQKEKEAKETLSILAVKWRDRKTAEHKRKFASKLGTEKDMKRVLGLEPNAGTDCGDWLQEQVAAEWEAYGSVVKKCKVSYLIRKITDEIGPADTDPTPYIHRVVTLNWCEDLHDLAHIDEKTWLSWELPFLLMHELKHAAHRRSDKAYEWKPPNHVTNVPKESENAIL